MAALDAAVPAYEGDRVRWRRPARGRQRRQWASIALQALIPAAVAGTALYLAHNVAINLRARGLASGFDFLWREAGFGIGFSVIPFNETNTYALALLVGLFNTILVAGAALFLATLVGVVVGVARTSAHPPTAAAALIYVEALRNIPLLVLVLFAYQILVNALPGVRQSLDIGGWVFLNNRGLVLPSIPGEFVMGATALFVALIATAVLLVAMSLRRAPPSNLHRAVSALLGTLLALELFAAIFLLDWRKPSLSGFNFRNGVTLVPEFVALAVALTIYNAAFIAEIVRAGIESVNRGQREAAAALGLSPGLIMRFILLPQALRVIFPPLANQYSHLVKASSLATVIGYPDLVNVFLGTALNQTGRAIEIVAITMTIYLALSASIAGVTSWFNHRAALVER